MATEQQVSKNVDMYDLGPFLSQRVKGHRRNMLQILFDENIFYCLRNYYTVNGVLHTTFMLCFTHVKACTVSDTRINTLPWLRVVLCGPMLRT